MENIQRPGIPNISRTTPSKSSVTVPDLNAEFCFVGDHFEISSNKLNIVVQGTTFEEAMKNFGEALKDYGAKFKGAPLAGELKTIVSLINAVNDRQLLVWAKATMKQVAPKIKPKEKSVGITNISSPNKEIQVNGKIFKVDPKTGKKYEVLPASRLDAVKNFKNQKGGPGLDFLRKSVEEVDDIDLDKLNEEADRFLAHLRVPPDKDEIARLREEKIRRQRAQDQAYEHEVEEMNEKDQEEIRKVLGDKK